MHTIHVDVVSAEASIFEGEAEFVALPGEAGELGIYPQHTPLITRIRPGEVRIKVPNQAADELIFVAGGLLEVPYGVGAGTIRSDTDVVNGMSKSMGTLASYLVLVFFAAQFVALFNWTQLGLIFAVEGADILRSWNLPTVPLFICFILLTATVNLFMGSASAKWALMAPVFVPMFMLLGYSPELAQSAYRIGDSVVNIITPLMSYFPLVLTFAQRYEPKAGIGTLVATMLPYSVSFLVAWTLLLVLWLLVGWPLGPGAPLFVGSPAP